MLKTHIHSTANLPAVLVVLVVLVLATGIHLGQAYTGRLEIAAPAGPVFEHGNFAIGSSTYPRKAIDHEGYSITVKRPARRIASVQWGIDDFVYSVADPETVIAVNESAYQRRISNVYEWAEKYRPSIASNAEVLLKLEPDLVFDTSRRGPDFADILRAGGIPTYRMFTLFTKLEDVANTILLTGYLTGRDAEGQRLYNNFQSAVRRAEARKPQGMPSPRILGFAGKYSYGDQTLFNDIVRTLGGINVGAEQGLHGYDPINTEQVLRWNPDWIVAGADRGKSDAVMRRLLDDPAIRVSAAARSGQILVLDNNVFLAMSPFTILTLDALGDALYPRKAGN